MSKEEAVLKNKQKNRRILTMADKAKATVMVVKFIKETGLYSFKSLTEETQHKLIEAYGSSIETSVNASLNLA